MSQDDQGRNARDTQIVDPAAETSARASAAAGDQPSQAGSASGGVIDDGSAAETTDMVINNTADESGKLPPPSAHRPDTMVRGVSPEARVTMERGGDSDFGNNPSFTKGINAPTMDQTRGQYTVEQMDEFLTEAPRPLFPDTPGGDGATPLSVDRTAFLAEMGSRGRFPSQQETEKWAKAVFNALRQRAIEVDDTFVVEFTGVVRVGEAPEVQVEEMMWGGDPIDRMSRLVPFLGEWTRAEFYEQVAEEAGETVDDPWVDAAVHSFLGTLKSFMGNASERMGNLGELQSTWEQA